MPAGRGKQSENHPEAGMVPVCRRQGQDMTAVCPENDTGMVLEPHRRDIRTKRVRFSESHSCVSEYR